MAVAPLLRPLATLRGVGPRLAGLLARAIGGPLVIDLLFALPEYYVDRRERRTIGAVRPGDVATLAVEIVRHEPPATPRHPFKAVAGDGTGFLDLVFWGRGPRNTGWAERVPVGARLLVSGKVEGFSSTRSIAHPDHIVPVDQADAFPGIDPVWRLTEGLHAGIVRRAMARALEHLTPLPEWHDPLIAGPKRWPAFDQALRARQAPATLPEPGSRERLAYDELLASQIAHLQVRRRERARPGRPLVGDGTLRDAARKTFGHALTASQLAALREIDADLAAPARMLRLLQGDVGSGKTIVALLAMLRAVEAGSQAALMVPTELLAQQHHRLFSRVSPIPAALLTGSVKGAPRREILTGLADGTIKLVIGTHALFQDAVAYRDLGLAVIDEQHRFGVNQRLLLGGKGEACDLLVMTATPIPRTLLLTQWHEMAVSRLTGKPAGRPPIRTTLHSLAALDELCDAVARALDRGAHVYWVCPLVAESEHIDLAAAEDRFAGLQARFGARVGLAHGRQESAVREAALRNFAAGDTPLLVATTVVEVGVDVAQASVMVIEHAERFGLAQLHQLRGRVGRGTEPSFCLLLHDDRLSDPARQRLLLLRDTDDGYVIADVDFRLRGGGEALGTRQSGARAFRVADLVEDEALLHLASKDAAALLDGDAELVSPRGQAVQALLALFGRDEPARTLSAG